MVTAVMILLLWLIVRNDCIFLLTKWIKLKSCTKNFATFLKQSNIAKLTTFMGVHYDFRQ